MTPLRVLAVSAVFVAVSSPAVLFGQANSEVAWAAPAIRPGANFFNHSYSPVATPPAAWSSSLPDDPSALIAQQAGGQERAAPAPAKEEKEQQTETDDQRKTREAEEGEEQVKKEEHQRNFGVIPNFNTVIGGKVPPLTPKQKFSLVFHTTTDPYTFAIAFIVGGSGELSPPAAGYGWGAGGYFYRVGTAYADNVDGALWGNAILPVILHQDPRYYRKGTGSIPSRIVYSALSTIICHGDNGNRQFSYSNVFGNLIAGGISNAYYPAQRRGTAIIYQNALTVTLEGAVGAQLLEFAPDISNYIHKRKEHHRQMLRQQGKPVSSPAPGTKPDDY